MRSHAFHRSSFRPQLVMGAERKPMLFLLMMCTTLAVTSVNLVAVAVAGVLWVTGQFALVWIAKIDPQMAGVFARSRRYPGYIPPHTSPFRKGPGYVVSKSTGG